MKFKDDTNAIIENFEQKDDIPLLQAKIQSVRKKEKPRMGQEAHPLLLQYFIKFCECQDNEENLLSYEKKKLKPIEDNIVFFRQNYAQDDDKKKPLLEMNRFRENVTNMSSKDFYEMIKTKNQPNQFNFVTPDEKVLGVNQLDRSFLKIDYSRGKDEVLKKLYEDQEDEFGDLNQNVL